MLKIKRIYRYSESFKQQVLEELSLGIYSANELQRRYGIKGSTTIAYWARKSGNFNLIPKTIRVETPQEKDEIAALKLEIKRLKMSIADIVTDRVIAESTLEVICEQQGLNIEEVKKKAGSILASKPSKKGRK
ncbi:transposase [Aquirufa nivalisilvae]